MSFLFRFFYVFSSWCPLFLLMGIASFSTNSVFAAGCAIGFILSFIIFVGMVLTIKSGGKDYKTIFSSQNYAENIFSYTLSILPPVMIDDFTNLNKVLTVVVFYIIVFFILIKSHVLTLNPMFIIFGYKISKVKFNGSSNAYTLISRKATTLQTGKIVSTYEIYRSGVFYTE